MKNILLAIVVLFLSSCMKHPLGTIDRVDEGWCAGARLPDGTCKWDKSSVTGIALSDGSLIISGTKLVTVTSLKLTGANGYSKDLVIQSQSNSSIIAKSADSVAIVLASVLNLVVSDAEASTSYSVTFEVADGSITVAKFSTVGANPGDVFQWDGSDWILTPLTGLNYVGAWNASTDTPDLADAGANTSPIAGDYYVISVTGATNIDGITSWTSGDWIIFNGDNWDKISNSGSGGVTSFNTRTGAVTAASGDYSFAMINNSVGGYLDYYPNNAQCSDNYVLKYDSAIPGWKCASDETGSSGSSSTGVITLNADSDGVGGEDLVMQINNLTKVTLHNSGEFNVGTEAIGSVNMSITEALAPAVFAIGEDGSDHGKITWNNTNNYISMGTQSTADGTDAETFVVRNGMIGIGTTDPQTRLHLNISTDPVGTALYNSSSGVTQSAQNTSNIIDLIVTNNAGVTGARSAIRGIRARGTLETPLAAANGDMVLSLLAGVYDGTSVRNTGDIKFTVDGNVSTGVTPVKMSFSTVTGGSWVEHMTIKNSGNVGIGTTTPEGALHVDGGRTGTGTISGASTTIAGVGTSFTSELSVGDNIVVGAEGKLIIAIASDTSLTIRNAFSGDPGGATFTIKKKTVFENGYIGLGTNTPQVPLHINLKSNTDGLLHPVGTALYNDSSFGLILSAQDNAATVNLAVAEDVGVAGYKGGIVGVRSRGTLEAPSAAGLNDNILSIMSGIYDGTSTLYTARMMFTVDGAVSTGVAPAKIAFTTKTGGSGAWVDRMTIKNDGNVGIGTTAPIGKLHVSATNSSALVLRDVDTDNLDGDADYFTGTVENTFVGIGTDSPGGGLEIELPAGGYNLFLDKVTTNPQFVFAQAGTPKWGMYFDVTNNSFNIRDWDDNVDRITIDNSGNVGIGTISPSYKLHVNGSVAGVGVYNALSDERYKRDITTLADIDGTALEKILKLNGKYFYWRQDEFPKLNFKDGRDIGVIAQEIEKVFPEAVVEDKDGYRSVAYSKLVAPLIEATKELAKENQEIKAENRIMKEYLCVKFEDAPFCK